MTRPAPHLLARRRFIRRIVALSFVLTLLGPALAPGWASASSVSATSASATSLSTLTPAQVQAKQWWVVRLNLEKTWKITRGAGVTVAVLDTGVQGDFPDLRGAIVPGFDSGGGPGTGTVDHNRQLHGTRIADEIAGRGTGFGLLGVAPQAKILPVYIRQTATTDGTTVALDRLSSMAHPPQVVNMSYGTALACPAGVQQAVSKAIAAGMILVASAGNSGGEANPAEYPADCKGVVAAAAINNNGHVWISSERQKYVALAGPGVHLIGYYAKAPGYGYGTGTSDAGAMVSGTMALVRARFPAMPARQVVARVLATAHQFIGKQGSRNSRDGYGVALPYAALTQRVPANAPNPIYDALGSGTAPSTSAPSPSSSPSGSPSSEPSPSIQPSASAASGPTAAPSTTDRAGIPPATAAPAAVTGGSGSGPDVGLIVGIAFAVIVIAFAVFLVLVRSRGRRPPAGGPPAGSWS